MKQEISTYLFLSHFFPITPSSYHIPPSLSSSTHKQAYGWISQNRKQEEFDPVGIEPKSLMYVSSFFLSICSIFPIFICHILSYQLIPFLTFSPFFPSPICVLMIPGLLCLPHHHQHCPPHPFPPPLLLNPALTSSLWDKSNKRTPIG